MPDNFGQQLADGVIAWTLYLYFYMWNNMFWLMLAIHLVPFMPLFMRLLRRRPRFS